MCMFACRNVSSLVSDIVPVLSDSPKAVLLHQICQFLPAQVQDEFDQRAASMLGEGALVVVVFDSVSLSLCMYVPCTSCIQRV